ncbi:OLC1v1018173C1 [Oldenlandia corymbosa var. corymbosa]|uniref:Non-specific lipid-transfer protein n=1 Tax=Oldenlandia corymbosa var. corymbosa TaxID=529605 RepID=A0AAV1EB06_OLDCO|nr:OLC1v1018173C1 [Oldenlandia corymbosa var. corymbosa]
MKGFIVAMLAVLAVVQMMSEPAQAVTCPEVAGHLAPCVNYLTAGGKPGRECCQGVEDLIASVKTQADKRAACNCVKAAATTLPVRDEAAQALPSQCGVTLDIPISKNVNCEALF